MESTSKEMALEMLKDIVEGDHQWVQNDQSLSALGGNPWIDSELEARFPEAMARFSGQDCVGNHKVRVSQDIVRGKHGYRLTIGTLGYEVEPQVDLGANQGVQFASCPDFVLWPVRTGLKAVVVVLDGYKYHQTKSSEDLLKRQSLIHAGFVVWTLNWYDVNKVLGDKAMDVPLPTGMTSPDQHHTAIAGLAKVANVGHTAQHLSKTTFELLMHYLAEQDSRALAKQALFFLLQCLPANSLADAGVKQKVLNSRSGLPASFTDLTPAPAALVGSVELHDDKAAAAITLDLIAAPELVKKADLNRASVTLCYDLRQGNEDDARYQWQRFWTAVNFLQFLPLMYAYTPQSKHDGTAAGLLWPDIHPSHPEQTEQDKSPEWFEMLDSELAGELGKHEVVWPGIPLVGDDVLDANEEVIGLAEIIFEEQKIAFLLEDQLEIKPRLEADGWLVLETVEDLVAAINNLDSGA